MLLKSSNTNRSACLSSGSSLSVSRTPQKTPDVDGTLVLKISMKALYSRALTSLETRFLKRHLKFIIYFATYIVYVPIKRNPWINPRTYRGGGMNATPPPQHLMFSVAVRWILARILSEVHWWSVSMVTRYDVISRRWSSHFWVKVHVFSTFSTIKVNLVAKIMHSAY